MEILQRVQLFAHTGQLDRRTGDLTHGERRAATGVTVHPRHHDPGHAQGLVEGAGGVDRVLSGHRVHDEEGFRRVGRLAHRADLIHQRLIDREPAGGVEDDDVEHLTAPHLHGTAGNLHRGLAGHDRQRADAGLLRQLLQLQLRGRALRVERGEQHPLSLALGEAQRELARGRRLAGTLQAYHQERDWRGGVQIERNGPSTTERFDQLIVDDLDDHLARADAIQHFGAQRPLAHAVDEIPHHRQRHVRLEQRQPHLAQGVGNVVLRQPAARAEPVENVGELARQRVEHGSASSSNAKAPLRGHAERRWVIDRPLEARRRLVNLDAHWQVLPTSAHRFDCAQFWEESMRTTSSIIAVAGALICAAPHAARAQNPSQLLQGLMSGNQGQDQAVREAFERGYRHGREDQARDDRDRRPPPPRGPYPDQDPNYPRNYQR